MSKRPDKVIGNGTGRFGSYRLNEVTDHQRRDDWWAYGGQAEFTEAGNYDWTCPSGTQRVHVWATGGGGGGQGNWAEPAGGGAGSAWRNNIKVTGGQTYTVHVGDAGSRGNSYGQSSFFIEPKCLFAGGGAAASEGNNGSDNSDARFQATVANFPGISTYSFPYNPGEGGRHGHVNHAEGEGRGGGGWYAGDKGDQWDGNSQTAPLSAADSHGMNSGGGTGGHNSSYQGGGGAGGYGWTSYEVSQDPSNRSGRNTSGGDQQQDGKRGGAGGGGYYSSTHGCSAGGGVGIWGTGGNGNAGTTENGKWGHSYGNNGHPRGGGNRWSGGGNNALGGGYGIGGYSNLLGYGPSDGSGAENPWGFNYSANAVYGGWPGGGGGGPGTSHGGGRGGPGAIRIIWDGERGGSGARRYPGTNTEDIT